MSNWSSVRFTVHSNYQSRNHMGNTITHKLNLGYSVETSPDGSVLYKKVCPQTGKLIPATYEQYINAKIEALNHLRNPKVIYDREGDVVMIDGAPDALVFDNDITEKIKYLQI